MVTFWGDPKLWSAPTIKRLSRGQCNWQVVSTLRSGTISVLSHRSLFAVRKPTRDRPTRGQPPRFVALRYYSDNSTSELGQHPLRSISLTHGAEDLDARGRSPMCRQSSRPSLGGEAGGRSLGFISLLSSAERRRARDHPFLSARRAPPAAAQGRANRRAATGPMSGGRDRAR